MTVGECCVSREEYRYVICKEQFVTFVVETECNTAQTPTRLGDHFNLEQLGVVITMSN